jgi:dihydroorotate dehydrogenase
MIGAAGLSRFEAGLRPLLTRLPPAWAVRLYSRGRRHFLKSLADQPPRRAVVPPAGLGCELWGLRFRSPLLNAAGMFKNGEGYALAAAQGAGGWLAGTTTGRPRVGNTRAGIATPFAPYPRSHAASNWLGLPNPGHAVVAKRFAGLEKVAGCPAGASLTADPDPSLAVEEKLAGLAAGMRLYEEAGADFLEINESCPNTEAGAEDFGHLEARLRHVAAEFLSRRRRNLPVVVKFSNDTEIAQVPKLLGLLVELGYDGVNFGNTSTAYRALEPAIDVRDRPLYDYFTATFGGGVSGRPLRGLSLELCRAALAEVGRLAPAREFHVWRTGGIESAADVAASAAIGVRLNQWYSGYFEQLSCHGHDLYRRLYRDLC